MSSWGVVSTIKASSEDILNFVAHHLELGAKHLWIYLDDDAPEAMTELKAHPLVSATRTRKKYWLEGLGKRPPMHQHRQTFNAEHAYARSGNEIEWLAHIDVDEFLFSNNEINSILDTLPDTCVVGRVRPCEALAKPSGTEFQSDIHHFKAFVPNWKHKRDVVADIYPNFGEHLKGGFVSHVAGKMFIRTGVPNLQIRIHNVFQGEDGNPGQVELTDVELLHFHTTSWKHWNDVFSFRHRKGSYRADLGSARPLEQGGMTMHQLLDMLAQERGGLDTFYREVCLDTPALRDKLEQHEMLRTHRLRFDETRRKHFPNFV